MLKPVIAQARMHVRMQINCLAPDLSVDHKAVDYVIASPRVRYFIIDSASNSDAMRAQRLFCSVFLIDIYIWCILRFDKTSKATSRDW